MNSYKWSLLVAFLVGALLVGLKYNWNSSEVQMQNNNGRNDDSAFNQFKLMNSNYSEQDLKFIEEALIKEKVIISLHDLIASHLRLFIEEQNEARYMVHIGSENPTRGGSGSTYSVQKSTGAVKLESSETYAPDPHSGSH